MAEARSLSLTVNGDPRSAEVEPRTLLVDLLRDTFDLTGTKVGCDTGQCGACTVLIDGRSVKSCTVLALQAGGAEVTTVEGLASNGRLTPLQESLHEEHGVQCGFCTPGMVVGLTDLLRQQPDPQPEEIREWLKGHLCRCTGYENVVKAVRRAVEQIQSPIGMVADTPGKKFYLRQVENLIAGDPEQLVELNYTPDALLTSAEFVVRGKDALKEHFRQYLKWVKIKKVISTDKFVETDSTLLFEATVLSNYGVAKVYDAFVVTPDWKITHHFTGVR